MGDFVLKYWIGIAFGVVAAFIGEMCRRYKAKFKMINTKHHATELGVRALLRNQIIVVYNKYSEKGSIPIYELENLDDLVKQYENLGGNGVIKELVGRIMELDISK
jgi:hypothetical protein